MDTATAPQALSGLDSVLSTGTAPGTAGQNKPTRDLDEFRVVLQRSKDGAEAIVVHSTDAGLTASFVKAPVDFELLEAWLGSGTNEQGKPMGVDAIVDRLKRDARFAPYSRRLIGEFAYINEKALVEAPHLPSVVAQDLFLSDYAKNLIATGIPRAMAIKADQVRRTAGRRY